MPEFSARVNLVDIRDVAPGVIAALEKGRSGERYILAGDNISAREDLVLMVSGILGKMPHLVRPPKRLLDFLARSSEFFRKLFGKSKISFYPDIVHLLNYDWAYTSKKARDELGYKTRSLFTSLNDLLSNNFTGTYMKPEESD